ncbi:esterase/lipase family protein [Paraburkholderia sp. GAS334]|uniref:esterase/lipase family protein n=1 Tax=Paraburkholderia sp. GAS334 TaxID=3035131 RepID=UPI003D233082
MDTLERKPPPAVLLALEPLRAISDYVAGHAPLVEPLPRGDGHPVLVFPGLGASGAATAGLRERLQALDYDVHDWEQGINQWPNADFEELLLLLGDHLKRIYARSGHPVSLIGWSLGGVYARELAKKHPELVRQVITLATPFADQPNSTHAGWLFTLLNGGVSPVDEALLKQLSIDPAVPCTSVYSPSDGIVGWQGCIGTESAHHRNIEVDNVSHMGMVHNPEVLRVVAGLLAEPRHGAFRTFIDTCIAKVFKPTEAKHVGEPHTSLSPPEPPGA